MQALKIASRRAPPAKPVDEMDAEPQSGFRLGPYELLESLGRGGMGEVLHAYDRSKHTEVALKVPNTATDRDDVRAAFYREFRLATSVAHRNVLRVHALELIRDLPVLVMEYVRGESLTEVIRTERTLRPADALYLADELCSAAAAIHEADVIHCDLKPDNIALCDGGRVVVMDFGIARRIGEEPRKVQWARCVVHPCTWRPNRSPAKR
jgi:eukaryotic-like serine/threonine-protein kinase